MRRGGRLDRDEPWAIWQLGFDAGHDGCRTFGYDFLEATRVSTWIRIAQVPTYTVVVVVVEGHSCCLQVGGWLASEHYHTRMAPPPWIMVGRGLCGMCTLVILYIYRSLPLHP